MTDTNNEWIEKAYKAYKKNIPNYINPIDSFKKAIEDNLPQSISREAVSKRETTEQQSENILTYEQGFERGKQVGYKEGRRDRGKNTTDEREVEIDELLKEPIIKAIEQGIGEGRKLGYAEGWNDCIMKKEYKYKEITID